LPACYICQSDFHVQARVLEYQCRVVTLCRLCSLMAVSNLIFKCSCGRYDFLAKYPHRVRILVKRLHLPSAALDSLSLGLAVIESSSCQACQAMAKKKALGPGKETAAAFPL
jgi:hypothetical protein